MKSEHCKNRTNIYLQKQNNNNARISTVECLSINEYIIAKQELCRRQHNNCKKCIGEITAAKIVSQEKVIPLPNLWRRSFQGLPYNCEKAQRKLLQMPLIAINYNSKVFITAKSEKNKLNEIKEIIRLKFPENRKESQEVNMSTEDMNTLISVASNESEKTLLKHTVCNAYNLSKRQAKTLYGISRVRRRAEKVSEAASKIAEINSKHDFLAQLEQRSYLFALGLNVGDYIPELSSDSESEISEVELSSDDDDECSPTFAAVKQDIEHEHVVNSFIAPERAKDNLDENKSGESHCDTNFSSNYVHTALAKLKSVSFNWFAFVALLQP